MVGSEKEVKNSFSLEIIIDPTQMLCFSTHQHTQFEWSQLKTQTL